LNHFEGFDKNWLKPDDGEVAREVGNERIAGEGADVECVKESWGLNALEDGDPRRGVIFYGGNVSKKESFAFLNIYTVSV
jgi:hypothetical protein